jgi:hypothetical protein
MSETLERVSVEFHVSEVEPMRGCGALLALATVVMTTADGLPIELRGCTLRRMPSGFLLAQCPVHRHPMTRKFEPSLGLVPPLHDELGAAIIQAFEDGHYEPYTFARR